MLLRTSLQGVGSIGDGRLLCISLIFMDHWTPTPWPILPFPQIESEEVQMRRIGHKIELGGAH